MVKRPRKKIERLPLTRVQIESALYIGSAEHKVKRWWGGLPSGYIGSSGVATRPQKALTTICPLTYDEGRAKATRWVQDALREGKFEFYESDAIFPKKIWYDTEGEKWLGLCVNTVLGHYKGWPVSQE